MFPKPIKQQKKRKRINPLGRKGIDWMKAREELKQEFEDRGIVSCELHFVNICWRNNALGFAHVDKRTRLGPGELKKVILACNPCHDKIERMPREQMRKLVESVIRERGD